MQASATDTVDEEAVLLDLVGRIRFGDAEALGELYDRTLGRVHALALRVLRQPEDAEEVVSDVFLQVWDKAVSYCPQRGNVMPWLLTLAWSRSIDRLRRQRRQRLEQPLHPEGEEDAYTPCEDLPVDQMIDRLNASQTVRQALASLTAAQRQVLELAYGQELSQPEISERTGLPLGTVKSHARRGLAALRESLAPEGAHPGQGSHD